MYKCRYNINKKYQVCLWFVYMFVCHSCNTFYIKHTSESWDLLVAQHYFISKDSIEHVLNDKDGNGLYRVKGETLERGFFIKSQRFISRVKYSRFSRQYNYKRIYRKLKKDGVSDSLNIEIMNFLSRRGTF